MKHLFRIGGALLLYVAVIHFLGSEKKEALTAESSQPAANGPAPVSAASPREDPLFAKQTEQRIKQLTSQVEHRAKGEQAKKEMAASRHQLQTATYSAWKRVIDANQNAYLNLKAQAGQTSHQEVPCTICDGFSYMTCVMCPQHNGKCVSCNGSGRRGGSEYCPSCLGTGKCYLCTGSGKMFCPFCDDGMITTKRPPPSNFPPAH